jgi:hypothetical protein
MDQAIIFPFFRHYDEFGTKAAVAEQDKIGWYNLLLGRLSKNWTDAQQKYLESIVNYGMTYYLANYVFSLLFNFRLASRDISSFTLL